MAKAKEKVAKDPKGGGKDWAEDDKAKAKSGKGGKDVVKVEVPRKSRFR